MSQVILFLFLCIPAFNADTTGEPKPDSKYQRAYSLAQELLVTGKSAYEIHKFKLVPYLSSENRMTFRALLHPSKVIILFHFDLHENILSLKDTELERYARSPLRSGIAPSVSSPGAKPHSGTHYRKANEPFIVNLQTFSNGRGSLECGSKGCQGPVRPSRPGEIRCTLDGSIPTRTSNLCSSLQFYAQWEPCRPILIKATRIERGRLSPVVTFEYWLKQH